MEALHDVVRAGRVRYLGASSMCAWQFAKAQHVAESHGWTPFVSMQNHDNLIYRKEEREMIPLYRDQGVAVPSRATAEPSSPVASEARRLAVLPPLGPERVADLPQRGLRPAGLKHRRDHVLL